MICILGPQRRNTFAFLALTFFFSISSRAEFGIPTPGTATANYQVGPIYQSPTATNSQFNQGAPGDDRREKHLETNKKIEETNNSKLQPNMQQHNNNAMKHFKEAEQARQNKEEGKAKEEEAKGMMELMKAQQLNQQIQENKKTQEQNAQNAQILKNQEAITVPTVPKGSDLSKALNGENTRMGSSSPEESAGPPAPAESAIPATELVNLGSVSVPAAESRGAVPSSSSAGTDSRGTFGYDERGVTTTATPSGSSAAQGSNAASLIASIPSSPAGALGAGVTQTGGGGAGGSSGGAGDFFANVGSMVDQENRLLSASEEKFSLKGLRGAMGKKDDEKVPGAGLSDEAFWKKVGKEPAKCKAASAITKRQRQECLKLARKEFEKKWKQAQRRRPTTADPAAAPSSAQRQPASVPPAAMAEPAKDTPKMEAPKTEAPIPPATPVSKAPSTESAPAQVASPPTVFQQLQATGKAIPK